MRCFHLSPRKFIINFATIVTFHNVTMATYGLPVSKIFDHPLLVNLH
ncbi:hypothetical protein [Citrobacter phage vB_CfrS_K1M]